MRIEDQITTKLIKTPAYVIDERRLIKNLELLKDVQDRTGAKILLALKGLTILCSIQSISIRGMGL